MSRRAMAVVAAVVVGAAVLIGVRVFVNESGNAAAGTGVFAAQTAWGEPNLTGV